MEPSKAGLDMRLFELILDPLIDKIRWVFRGIVGRVLALESSKHAVAIDITYCPGEDLASVQPLPLLQEPPLE